MNRSKRSVKNSLPRLILALLLLFSTSSVLFSGGQAAAQSQDQFESLPEGARVESVLTGMYMPAAIAFDADGRLFYTEKNTGNVRIFHDGILETKPVISFEVSSCGERGLTGITLDPDFKSNRYIYVYYAEGPTCTNTVNKVVRFTENKGVGFNPIVLFTSPAYDQYHMGGGLHFGPDGKLYISIGDTSNSALSQDMKVPQGKIHRINSDGSIPNDNPFYNTPDALQSIYAYGFRNPFDFTFDPVSGGMFASENGPDCDDELNRVVAGYNYGWRPDYGCEDASGLDPAYNNIQPLWHAEPCCTAPTQVVFYTGNQVPQWKNQLFMSNFYGQLYHFYLEDDRETLRQVAVVGGVTANMAASNGPDGAFYFVEGGGSRLGILKRVVGPEFANSPVKPEIARDPYAAPVPVPGDESVTFFETGQTLNGLFLQYWREHGGLAQQGFPISAPLGEYSELNNRLYTVQYFERAVFEYHPELSPPFRVLLAQLGRSRYSRLYPEGAPGQAPSSDPGRVLIPETGYYLGGKFLDYWQRTGGVAQHGWPISEEFVETSQTDGKPYLVQYFERSVFELHPENQPPFDVQLSHLGTFEYESRHTR